MYTEEGSSLAPTSKLSVSFRFMEEINDFLWIFK